MSAPSSPQGDHDASGDQAAVLAANQAFYDAFEARDLEHLTRVWEHSDRAVCTHPGWPTLRGWEQVRESWAAIFDGPQRLQFILTGTHVDVIGDTAWVTVDENLLDDARGGTVAAVNWFVRDDGAWRMVGHHASSVVVSLSRE